MMVESCENCGTEWDESGKGFIFHMGDEIICLGCGVHFHHTYLYNNKDDAIAEIMKEMEKENKNIVQIDNALYTANRGDSGVYYGWFIDRN